MINRSNVLVVGKGNAALCAALAARDTGATVTILESAPEAESGGNSHFAGGVMRFAFDGVEDAFDLPTGGFEEDAEGRVRIVERLRCDAQKAKVEVRLGLLVFIPHVSWHVFTIR